jgi:hypothetical protein
MKSYYLLPDNFKNTGEQSSKIVFDYERFADEGMPENIEAYILDEYKIDISSKYGELSVRNPFGIASGQLSNNINQIENGIRDGIGFIVLKTVISEDGLGNSSMGAWKVNAPKMIVEEIKSKRGEDGFTVSWKGRGWHKSFNEYLKFIEDALIKSKQGSTPVIPSCKFNLPESKDIEFNDDEYRFTLEQFAKTWAGVMGGSRLYLEKDFSPTLAGSDMSRAKDTILWWLEKVPEKIRKFSSNSSIYFGMKIMNAVFDDDFQLEMLKTVLSSKTGPDYLICFNRLFDSERIFENKKGIAYGGYDLSDRNLKVLSDLRRMEQRNEIEYMDIPISATGNICSGKLMLEYALRGCENGQIHTYFQIPDKHYGMKNGSRVSKALHELIFNPDTGLLQGLIYLNETGLIEKKNDIVKFSDVVDLWKRSDIFKDWGEGFNDRSECFNR